MIHGTACLTVSGWASWCSSSTWYVNRSQVAFRAQTVVRLFCKKRNGLESTVVRVRCRWNETRGSTGSRNLLPFAFMSSQSNAQPPWTRFTGEIGFFQQCIPSKHSGKNGMSCQMVLLALGIVFPLTGKLVPEPVRRDRGCTNDQQLLWCSPADACWELVGALHLPSSPGCLVMAWS